MIKRFSIPITFWYRDKEGNYAGEVEEQYIVVADSIQVAILRLTGLLNTKYRWANCIGTIEDCGIHEILEGGKTRFVEYQEIYGDDHFAILAQTFPLTLKETPDENF